MRSRSERNLRLRACIAVAAFALAAPATAGSAGSGSAPANSAPANSAPTNPRPVDRPTAAQVDAAMRRLRQDPNLVSTTRIHALRWVASTDEPRAADPSWLRWIVNLFDWLAESGRLIVWIVCAVVVGLLGVYVLRLARDRQRTQSAPTVSAPTHVRDLDIRPETLPADIGAAARNLWEQAQHRAALSLLYRGLLSRLAHAHSVPIRHSTTEGESVELAGRYLDAGATGYVAQLVRVWQRAVYRGEEPTTEAVMSLCAGFADALDPPPAPAAAGLAA